MERLYEGLLRSIIYDVLRQCPDLIRAVSGPRWNFSLGQELGSDMGLAAWSMKELRECVKCFTRNATWHATSHLRFCFYVDGLDEYDGDHEDTIGLLHDSAKAENIKICASSHPWEIFINSFVASVRDQYALTLHLHTRPDMEKVIKQELHEFVSKADGEQLETK